MINNPPPLVAKYISFTRDITAATGNVSYTGVGFTPTAIIFIADKGSTYGSIGMSSDTLDKCLFVDAGAVSMQAYGIMVQTGGAGQIATLLSLDADGFTLAWTKQGAPAAGTVTVLAVCIA